MGAAGRGGAGGPVRPNRPAPASPTVPGPPGPLGARSSRGRPGRGSGGESVRRRGPARARRTGRAQGRRWGPGRAWLALRRSPAFAGGALPPARPLPGAAPRPPAGPGILAGACGFLPAPGARSWLAAGRGRAGSGRPAGAARRGDSSPSRGGSAPTRRGAGAGRLGRTRAPRSLRCGPPGSPPPQAPQPARHGVRRGQSDAADTAVATHHKPAPSHLRGLEWRPASAKGFTPGSWLANQMALAASDGGRGLRGWGWSPRQEPGAGSLSSDSPKVTQAIRGDVLTGAWGLL